MKRILVLGARAPVSLDLIRRLSDAEFEVFAADSVRHSLARSSNKIQKYFFVPPPAYETQKFIQALKRIIIEHKIDLAIPTCEEVFFVSKYREELEECCQMFCDDFDKIRNFHNKHQFMKIAKKYPVQAPETELISTTSQLRLVEHKSSKVFKPIYSRFASQTVICPRKQELDGIVISENNVWIAQRYVDGIEYCTYSIAVDGELQAHACYHAAYRAGTGSGIYFESVSNDPIQLFVREFIKGESFTGQIGFDFILTPDQKLFVIECNPRATSGLHCLPLDLNWKQILKGRTVGYQHRPGKPRMISLAIMVFGFKYFMGRGITQFIRSTLKAKDVIWDRKDMKPALYQLVAILEVVWRSFVHRVPLKDAATSDIEWNGEEI